MMDRKTVIDIDDTATWPTDIRVAVDQWIASEQYKNSVAMCEADDEFRTRLKGHYLRAYHFTRLLAHEVEMVRSQGLRPLTRSLIRDRIETALRHRAISQDEAKAFRQSHVFATGESQNRADQVCLVIGRRIFIRGLDDVEELLGTWGGEAFYMSEAGARLRPRLRMLGRPTVVTALIKLGDRQHYCTTPLPLLFCSAARGQNEHADVFYRQLVPPAQIESVSQEGEDAYRKLFTSRRPHRLR